MNKKPDGGFIPLDTIVSRKWRYFCKQCNKTVTNVTTDELNNYCHKKTIWLNQTEPLEITCGPVIKCG